MSRRGAGSGPARKRDHGPFEFVPSPALGARVVAVARELLREGLTAGEVCSLLTDAAQVLSKQEGGYSRAEWLELCGELYERDGGSAEPRAREPRLTAPGGKA